MWEFFAFLWFILLWVECLWRRCLLLLFDFFFKGSASYIMCVPSSVRQGYSRELFQFEEDRFDSVPALIRFYVGGRRPISQASGAVIFHPITRTLPLRVITERHVEPSSDNSLRAGGEKHTESNKRRSFSSTHADSLQFINPLLRWEEVCTVVHWNTLHAHKYKWIYWLPFFLCEAGVEVSLLTWKTWEGGLHFSLHNQTATYELVHYHKHATATYMCLSPLTFNVYRMQLCLSSRVSCLQLMQGSSFQSSYHHAPGLFLPEEKPNPNLWSMKFTCKWF